LGTYTTYSRNGTIWTPLVALSFELCGQYLRFDTQNRSLGRYYARRFSPPRNWRRLRLDAALESPWPKQKITTACGMARRRDAAGYRELARLRGSGGRFGEVVGQDPDFSTRYREFAVMAEQKESWINPLKASLTFRSIDVTWRCRCLRQYLSGVNKLQ